ncbi:hypothetical protein OGAPHI_000829 [Ogataea philodendri]|uniref:Protein FMP52, mitochondrial n=1 Tax=Ogataea philodendri TaxID=1378263 RepID=A0A9P8T997_9ASCO|nr:uncharacterized protein OGAPHI_000829 [Ogataea philodendri]KAH3671118.1 hypothetical protein OGAPHI_000829 [Ogataea philodendri]
MSSYFALGATGLCGNFFTNIALKSSSVSQVFTLTRREVSVSGEPSKLVATLEKDTEKWPSIIKSLDIPNHSTYYSSFGTTRKAAGSAEAFVKIDEGINVDAFTAAKESGKFDTAVLVSSTGANADSRFLYFATKGRIEDKLKALKFKRTIILRPGPLLGERAQSKGFGESVIRSLGPWVKGTPLAGAFGHPVFAEEVAKVAFFLSQKPIEKENEVIVVSSSEILKIVDENKL